MSGNGKARNPKSSRLEGKIDRLSDELTAHRLDTERHGGYRVSEREGGT
ncbi:MAG: hypothetical protein HY900_24555 [Deltaproteobacteria bacterium]|nr:hypothetical protein [Deltaproteobacteria bacterium]